MTESMQKKSADADFFMRLRIVYGDSGSEAGVTKRK